MASFEYLVSIFPQGTMIGRVVRGTVTAPSEELAEEAVYRLLLEKWGYSPDKDGIVNLFVHELEGVEN